MISRISSLIHLQKIRETGLLRRGELKSWGDRWVRTYMSCVKSWVDTQHWKHTKTNSREMKMCLREDLYMNVLMVYANYI